MGTTNVISISETTIKAMVIADNCTHGWGTIYNKNNGYYYFDRCGYITKIIIVSLITYIIGFTNILSSAVDVDTGHRKGQDSMLPLTGSVPVVLSLSTSKASTSL